MGKGSPHSRDIACIVLDAEFHISLYSLVLRVLLSAGVVLMSAILLIHGMKEMLDTQLYVYIVDELIKYCIR